MCWKLNYVDNAFQVNVHERSPSSPLPAATGPLLSVPASPLFTGFCSGIASHGFQCNGNSLKKKLGPVNQVFFIAAIRSIL